MKLSSITLSAGEAFQGQGDGCLRGWVVVFCPKHPTDISQLHALFSVLLQRQAGRFTSFLTGGKLRQGVWAARGEVKARRKPVSNEQEGFEGSCVYVYIQNPVSPLKKVVSKGTEALGKAGHIKQGVTDEEGMGGRILQMSKHFTATFLQLHILFQKC